ncbi:MAG: VTT domain-containing protein [Patescibacteria group bacterium]|nr:VTT domain-containing protein [Patescibacteria group bacterium]
MSTSSLSIILPWVIANGYLMIFAAIIVGGPIFISAAAFAAALGYLNVYIIFGLAFFGEMAVDIILYSIGRISRAGVVEKFGHYFGLTDLRILKLEKLLHEHTWKALFIIKYSPVIPVPGFVITGAAKLKFKKFFYILLALSLPKAILFTVIGYFFGRTYGVVAKYYNYGEYLLIAIVIIFIAVNYWFGRFSKKISDKEINTKL